MNTINVTPEQIRVATKANLDAMIEIATAQFAAVESAQLRQRDTTEIEDCGFDSRFLAGA